VSPEELVAIQRSLVDEGVDAWVFYEAVVTGQPTQTAIVPVLGHWECAGG
jgi:hypothetical protein